MPHWCLIEKQGRPASDLGYHSRLKINTQFLPPLETINSIFIQALQSWLLHLTFDVNRLFFVRDRFFSLVACLHADLRLVNNLSKGIAIFHRLH